jgi:hypothetical protein
MAESADIAQGRGRDCMSQIGILSAPHLALLDAAKGSACRPPQPIRLAGASLTWKAPSTVDAQSVRDANGPCDVVDCVNSKRAGLPDAAPADLEGVAALVGEPASAASSATGRSGLLPPPRAHSPSRGVLGVCAPAPGSFCSPYTAPSGPCTQLSSWGAHAGTPACCSLCIWVPACPAEAIRS